MNGFFRKVFVFVAFLLGGLVGFILTGSIPCTVMMVDSAGLRTEISKLDTADQTEIILGGGTNLNVCQLPIGEMALEPGLFLGFSLLIPLFIGLLFSIGAHKAFRSKI